MTPNQFDWTPLIARARAAALNAYSPYSKFRVGAAILDDAGTIFGGCNVECASFGLTVCAERVAVFSAVASGSKKFTHLAVACIDAVGGASSLRMPCGACRQVLAEMMSPEAQIYVDGVGVFTIKELMPDAFKLVAT